ncbi:MAG: NADH-quinone oxidoreductase subunit L, partial [Proteobacteria bacterium]|nr:NADH-quinone oxidoreductase subunit L [Pseudomonadota bacterium]
GVLVVPGVYLAHRAWRFFDLQVIDGMVNGVAWVTGALGMMIRPLQTGLVRNYALYLLLGAVLFIVFTLVR